MTTSSTVLRLRADDRAPARARDWLAQHARLDRVRRAEASLLLSELVTGAISGSRPRQDDRVTVTTDPGYGTLVVGVEPPEGSGFQGDQHGFRDLLLERFARRWGEAEDKIWFEVPMPGTTDRGTAGLTTEQLLAGDSGVDMTPHDELVERYRPFATRMSRRFKGKGVADEDVDQAALFGLIQALRRYDSDKGPFEPFAAATIGGELKRLLRDRGWAVTVPRPIKERALEVGQVTQALTQRLGRVPTPEDIASEMDAELDVVVEAQTSAGAYRTGSLDAPIGDSELAPVDLLPTDDDPSESWAWHAIGAGLALMPERERRILHMRFYEDMTQSEIAEVVGLSQMHVSRLLNRALDKLRAILAED
jgi:RNA polymerase sigma-B factor